MKIIYETGWNNAEFPEELSYDDPTGDKSGQYVVTKFYALTEEDLEKFIYFAREAHSFLDGTGDSFDTPDWYYKTAKELIKEKGWDKG